MHVSPFVLFVLPLLPAPVFAQDTSSGEVKTSTDENVPETVVTATRVEENTFDVPRSVEIVTREEMQSRGARTASEALRFRPGIWVQKTGHLGGSPILRGFMGNQVVYLVDGVRRNTASLFAGPNSTLQNIDALDIDRIEVVRGPGSVLYGSDAIGGVVNVFTNEPLRFSETTQFGGRLYSRFASVDLERSGRLEASISDQHNFAFVGVTARDIDDLRGGRDVGVQDPSGWREHDVDAQIARRIGEKTSLELFFQDFSRPNGYRYDRPNWRQEDDRELYGLRLDSHDLGFVDHLEATAYYHAQDSYIDELFFDSASEDDTLGFDLQGSTQATDEWLLVYGLHAHQDSVVGSDPQSGTRDPDVEWFNPSAFVLSQFDVTPRLRLDLGLRLDSFTLESEAPAVTELPAAIQTAIANGAFALSDLELSESDTALTGGIGAVYAVTDDTNVFAHVGRAFRAPNKGDLLSFGQFTFGVEVPSTDVEPESSISYEIGMRRELEDTAYAVTGFLTEVDDAIVSVPGTFNGSPFIDVNGNSVQDANEQVFVNTNSTGTVRAVGLEVEARHYLSRSWTPEIVGSNVLSLAGNFSWIYGYDTGSDEPLDRAYPANGLLAVRLEDERDARRSRWWVELETWLVRDFHRIPSTRKTTDSAFFVDPQDSSAGLIGGDGSLPGFGIVNLRGGRRIGEGTTIYLGVENLFDRAYRVKDSRIDGDGLSVVLGVEVAL